MWIKLKYRFTVKNVNLVYGVKLVFGTVIHKSTFQVRMEKLRFAGESRQKAETESENEKIVGYFGRSVIRRNRWQGLRKAEPEQE